MASYVNLRACLLLALAASLIALTVQSCNLSNERAKYIAERAEKQALSLKVLGYERAEASRTPEDITPDLAELAKAAAQAGAPARIAWRVRTVGVPYEIPADCPVIPPAGPVEGEGVPPPSPPPVLVSADIQALVSPDDMGRLHLAAKITATLTKGTWSQTKELPAESTDFQVHPDVAEAWAQYKNRPPRIVGGIRPSRQWRSGWTLAAGAMLDVEGSVRLGVFMGYGIHF